MSLAKRPKEALGAAHITVNKNAMPMSPRSPFVTSGLRLGTPAVTTRGYKEPECIALAEWICDVLDAPNNETLLANVRHNVTLQCQQFPGVSISHALSLLPFCRYAGD